jgi:parvulin-like peptidyl-prolyl isomerase
VKQVLRRSEASIDEVQKKLAAGTKLDDVARSLFPNLAPDQTPWDLGYLDFRKVPDAWREVVYSMKPGDVSGVLRGAGDRYWIVELVDRRENTAMTFEEARPAIAADLKRSRVDEARSQARKSLSEKAHVDRIRAPKAPVVTIPAEH